MSLLCKLSSRFEDYLGMEWKICQRNDKSSWQELLCNENVAVALTCPKISRKSPCLKLTAIRNTLNSPTVTGKF